MSHPPFPPVPVLNRKPTRAWSARRRLTHEPMLCVLYPERKAIEYTWDAIRERWVNEYRKAHRYSKSQMPCNVAPAKVAQYDYDCQRRNIELLQPVRLADVLQAEWDTKGWLTVQGYPSDPLSSPGTIRLRSLTPLNGAKIVGVWEGARSQNTGTRGIRGVHVLWENGIAVEYSRSYGLSSFLTDGTDTQNVVINYFEDQKVRGFKMGRLITRPEWESQTEDDIWTPQYLLK